MFSDAPATRQMHEAFRTADLEPRHMVVDPTEDPEVLADEVLSGVREGRFSFRRQGA